MQTTTTYTYTYMYTIQGKPHKATIQARHNLEALHNARFYSQLQGCDDIRSVIVVSRTD